MPQNIYDLNTPWIPGEFPAGLAIGDSWFWYVNENLMRSLVHLRSLKTDHSNVQLLGFNGARLAEYVGNGRFRKHLDHFMAKGMREGFSEFYISGGGNDAIDLGLALRKDCKGIAEPGDCFDPAALHKMLGDISSEMGALIHNILWAYVPDGRPAKNFFIHGYDYPVPDGRGFLNKHGWLKPPMDAANVKNDMDFRKEVARILIDQLNDGVLKHFHAPAQGVFYVDSRGTLSRDPATYRSDWANEMHPTNAGFAKIAQRWLPALRLAGLAT